MSDNLKTPPGSRAWRPCEQPSTVLKFRRMCGWCDFILRCGVTGDISDSREEMVGWEVAVNARSLEVWSPCGCGCAVESGRGEAACGDANRVEKAIYLNEERILKSSLA